MSGVSQTTPPTVEPVSVDEMIAFARIDDNYESATITTMLAAARRSVENYQQRQLVNATWKQYLDSFPYCIELARNPVASITSIEYYDTAGTLTTLSASAYQLDNVNIKANITLAPNQTWPNVQTDRVNPIIVTFVAGYGATAASVPESTRLAIMMLATHWFEHRVPVAVGTIVTDFPLHVKTLLDADAIIETY